MQNLKRYICVRDYTYGQLHDKHIEKGTEVKGYLDHHKLYGDILRMPEIERTLFTIWPSPFFQELPNSVKYIENETDQPTFSISLKGS